MCRLQLLPNLAKHFGNRIWPTETLVIALHQDVVSAMSWR